MSKDTLGEFGSNSSQTQAARATDGGKQTPRDVRNYSPPVGPSNINDSKSPGLHGTNHGNTCDQGKH